MGLVYLVMLVVDDVTSWHEANTGAEINPAVDKLEFFKNLRRCIFYGFLGIVKLIFNGLMVYFKKIIIPPFRKGR